MARRKKDPLALAAGLLDIANQVQRAGSMENVTLKGYKQGDYYRFDGQDARIVAEHLGLTLMGGGGPSFCGLPAHRLATAESEMLKHGYRLELSAA